MGFAPDISDPFYQLMSPPLDETPAQMMARQKREMDAQRISDIIDEDIRRHRSLMKREKHIVRILLLGQAESGKSTTLKNFQMRYARSAWEKERASWRAVVQLNVVRSVISILSIVEAEMNGESLANTDNDSEDLIIEDLDEGDHGEALKFTDRHQLLIIRLAPLRQVEAELKRRLGAGTEQVHPLSPMSATPFDRPYENPHSRRKLTEFSVRCWKDVLDPEAAQTTGHSPSSDSPTLTIAGCKDDMKVLWEDKSVRLALKRRKVRLLDSAGYFLNDLDRIATRNYAVSDGDVVRARLRTVGIQEHKILFDVGPENSSQRREFGWEWRFFDVGGCRTSRAAWLPFFDNANAIIFLAPTSCFDERLEEDPRVNRLEDSFTLWKSICSSKLLANTQLIVFLNKCDLLKRKLKRGVKVKAHLPSYGDRANDVITVVKYLREKFKDIQKHHSPQPRSYFIYPTTVTDTEATAKTLELVRDGVLREHLAASKLI